MHSITKKAPGPTRSKRRCGARARGNNYAEDFPLRRRGLGRDGFGDLGAADQRTVVIIDIGQFGEGHQAGLGEGVELLRIDLDLGQRRHDVVVGVARNCGDALIIIELHPRADLLVDPGQLLVERRDARLQVVEIGSKAVRFDLAGRIVPAGHVRNQPGLAQLGTDGVDVEVVHSNRVAGMFAGHDPEQLVGEMLGAHGLMARIGEMIVRVRVRTAGDGVVCADLGRGNGHSQGGSRSGNLRNSNDQVGLHHVGSSSIGASCRRKPVTLGVFLCPRPTTLTHI